MNRKKESVEDVKEKKKKLVKVAIIIMLTSILTLKMQAKKMISNLHNDEYFILIQAGSEVEKVWLSHYDAWLRHSCTLPD